MVGQSMAYAPATATWPLRLLWLRPSRQQRALPGVRDGDFTRGRGGHVKRWLLILGRLLSLVLCSLCLILWLSSKIAHTAVWHEGRDGRNWYVVSTDGDLILAWRTWTDR